MSKIYENLNTAARAFVVDAAGAPTTVVIAEEGTSAFESRFQAALRRADWCCATRAIPGGWRGLMGPPPRSRASRVCSAPSSSGRARVRWSLPTAGLGSDRADEWLVLWVAVWIATRRRLGRTP